MLAALLYLQTRSSWNRLIARLRRLKKPKYLAGFIVGGLYFYFYFFRFMFQGGRRTAAPVTAEAAPETLLAFELAGALALFVVVLLAWLVPHRRAALTFSEAEVAFLFPAPVSRRTLIHFKLLKSQAGIFFTTLVLSLLSARSASSAGWMHLAGWWLILSTLNLHFLGCSFARTLLLDHGMKTWQRRLAVAGLALALVALTTLLAQGRVEPFQLDYLASARSLADYVARAIDHGPMPWVLLPFRLLVRPFLAPDAGAFFTAAAPALALLWLHYWWVVRADVAFEEASLDSARQRAEAIAAVRSGNSLGAARRKRRDPFPLRPTGPPSVALFWKNLIGAGSVFTLRTWLILSVAFLFPAAMISLTTRNTELSQTLGSLLLMCVVWSLLLGPQLLRQDFRADLASVDALKLYPLPGWHVVLGELLAPAVILSAIQWLLLAAATVLLAGVSSRTPLPLSLKLALALGAALILPWLNFLSYLIPNAAALLFPAWVQTGPQAPHGIEATGQRLIFLLGQMLVFLVSLLPAAAAFALVFFALRGVLGPAGAVPVASVASVAVLAAEAAAGVLVLGRIFDRFDSSAEPAG
jgi:hypothetical protein